MTTSYLDELNEGQRAAVVYTDGPQLVVAGAGSGKTRVLTCKIAFLLEQGFQPWQILALTFTNKAAREMKGRIALQVGPEQAAGLWMGTFHSIFLRMLRTHAQRLGFSPQFTIYDTADTKSLIRTLLKELNLSEKTYKPNVVQARISQAKNRLITPEQYAQSAEARKVDSRQGMPALHEVYQQYWNRCQRADAMDFDDLLFQTHILLHDHPEVRDRYQSRFRYILVDEYQDTNFAQHRIVEQLAGGGCRVCVVGDDAQSIYSFRGAEIDNMLNFTRSFPQARTFKLEQNYRSTQNIVNAANSLIDKNRRQIRKNVFSDKEVGEPLEVIQAYSDVEEGELIIDKLAELKRRERREWDHFVVLYRTHAQSRIFEEALRKREIPYRIYGGLSFYQRKEVKDVIAYFRLTVNPHDEEALRRIINYPTRGIGDTSVGKLSAAASERGVSLWTALCRPEECGLAWTAGTATKLTKFRELIEGFIGQAESIDAYHLGRTIIQQSGIVADLYKDTTPEGVSRQENLEELVNGLGEFCAQRSEQGQRCLLTDFLSEVSLLTDQDSDNDGQESRVTLMTIHAAKGLEYPVVFVVGLEEGLFPNSMVGESERGMEEERRLFYVAITRAEERCFLSYAKARRRFGLMDFATPSRFLRDIDRQYLSLPDDDQPGTYSRSISNKGTRAPAFASSFGASPSSSGSFIPAGMKRLAGSKRRLPTAGGTTVPVVGSKPAPTTDVPHDSSTRTYPVQVGQTVEHPRFGMGEVLALEGEDESAKATIRFRNAGTKQLLLRFARIKVVDK